MSNQIPSRHRDFSYVDWESIVASFVYWDSILSQFGETSSAFEEPDQEKDQSCKGLGPNDSSDNGSD